MLNSDQWIVRELVTAQSKPPNIRPTAKRPGSLSPTFSLVPLQSQHGSGAGMGLWLVSEEEFSWNSWHSHCSDASKAETDTNAFLHIKNYCLRKMGLRQEVFQKQISLELNSVFGNYPDWKISSSLRSAFSHKRNQPLQNDSNYSIFHCLASAP